MKLPALVLAATLLTPMLHAQAPPPPPPPPSGSASAGGTIPMAEPTGPLPSFLIADVHSSKYSPYPNMHGGQIFGDRYILHDANMVDLIHTAYGLDANNIQGGPSWLERDRFEIIAKVPPHTTAVQARLMLRQLLTDRFQLVTHTGMKPMPAWAITVKDASRMKEAANPGSMNCKNDNPPPAPGSGPPHTISLTCTSARMEWFTNLVRGWLGTNDTVIDKTNLTGQYDIHFTATPAQLIPQAGADAIPVQVALEKDLGLQLTHDVAPRQVLLVDSVLRKPTPNSPNLAKELPQPPPPEFEVATIKPSDPNGPQGANGNIEGGQVKVRNFTLKILIPIAWDLNEGDDNAIANAPKWFDTDKFDIVAKVAPEAVAASTGTEQFGQSVDIDDLRRALQKLILDRFQMKVHMEDRPIDSYRLIAVGPKMKAADPSVRTSCKEGPGPDGKDPRITNPALNRLLTCTNISMDELSDELQRLANGYIHNPIENATGLKGGYDFTLSFSAAGTANAASAAAAASPNGSPAASDPNGAITLQDAVQHQLGLKLEKVKRPLPVLVIDAATEKPLDN